MWLKIKRRVKALIIYIKMLTPFISPKYLYLGKGCFFDIRNLNKIRISPNLIIIGAQKSGTTSLHNYLDKHPDIFMSKPLKEPGYFMDFDRIQAYMKGRGRYILSQNILLRNFMLKGYIGQKIFGESSTYYTIGRQGYSNNVPNKIYNCNPNAKIIYIIRNPLERIKSEYIHSFSRNQTKLKFNDYLSRNYHAVLTSLYYYQIKPYVELFPIENLKIILFENLIDETNSILNDVVKFLNLPNYIRYPDPVVFNKSQKNELAKSVFYSKSNYLRIMPVINKDLKSLKNQLNISTEKWDLSFTNWVNENE